MRRPGFKILLVCLIVLLLHAFMGADDTADPHDERTSAVDLLVAVIGVGGIGGILAAIATLAKVMESRRIRREKLDELGKVVRGIEETMKKCIHCTIASLTPEQRAVYSSAIASLTPEQREEMSWETEKEKEAMRTKPDRIKAFKRGLKAVGTAPAKGGRP